MKLSGAAADNDRVTALPAEPKPRAIRQKDALSPDLRALMAEFGYSPKNENGTKAAVPKSSGASLMQKTRVPDAE